MHVKNSHVEYDSIPYDVFAALGRVEDLPGAAVTDHANAVVRVDRTPEDRILAVAPTSLATSYKLAQTPLTAIDLPALPDSAYNALAGATDRDLSHYTLLVLGRPRQHDNHTLHEYA